MALNQDHISAFLGKWAASTVSSHFAVLLEGRWGCGKTHFVNSLIDKDNMFVGRKVIYLSLFGISDAASLQTQLFYASASKLTKWSRQGLGIAGSVFSASLSVGSGGLLGGNADLGKVVESAGLQIEKATQTLDDAVLILDDVERTHIPISELLGIVNRFVEHGDTRVILVANTDGFRDKEQQESFQSFKEKIVGYSFTLSGDSDAVFSDFLDQHSDDIPIAVLNSQRELISELYNLSGYENLRALRQFLYFLSSLLSEIDDGVLFKNEFSSQLVRAAFVLFFEFKLDLSEESRALSLKDIWDFDRVESSGSFDLGAYVDEKSDTIIYYHHFDEDQPPPYGQIVLKKYAQIQLETVLPRPYWRTILEGKTIDTKELNGKVRSSSEVGWDHWPEWRRLWHFYQWNFNHESEKQFWQDIDGLNTQIESGAYTHPKEFLHVAGILLMLSEEDIILESQTDLLQRMKTYIDDHVIPKLSYETFRHVRRDFDTGYDGLGFIKDDSAEFQEIRSYLNEKMDAWVVQWKAQDAGLELLDYLPDQLMDFLGNIVVINHGEQRYLKEPILHTIEPSKFVEKWFTLERGNERMLVGKVRDRYATNFVDPGISGKDLLLAEAPWWCDVQTELLERAKKIQMNFNTTSGKRVKHPRAAQIGHLIDGISRAIIDPNSYLLFQNSPDLPSSKLDWLRQDRISSDLVSI